jgi:hypothetical protein
MCESCSVFINIDVIEMYFFKTVANYSAFKLRVQHLHALLQRNANNAGVKLLCSSAWIVS